MQRQVLVQGMNEKSGNETQRMSMQKMTKTTATPGDSRRFFLTDFGMPGRAIMAPEPKIGAALLCLGVTSQQRRTGQKAERKDPQPSF